VARDLKVLDKHFARWREAGLVSAELEAQLRAASRDLSRRSAGTAVRVALACLGGGLLLAGLTLIVAENWQALPRGLKLVGWAALQLTLLLGSDRLARVPGQRALSGALTLVAGGWVLAGIALVSQIYHLDSRPPNGIWLWLALVLPGAWLLERGSAAAVVFVALLTGLFMEAFEKDSWMHATHPDGPWLWLGLPALAGGIVSWLPRPAVLLKRLQGAWVFGASMFFLLVLGAAQELDSSSLGPAWIPAGLGVAALLALPLRLLPWDPTTSRLFVAGSLVPWVLMGAQYDAGRLPDRLGVGLSWVLQLALAVLVIRAGARGGAESWVNLGYMALLAGIVTRYFDFFGDYLEGGAALALTGVLLLGALWLLARSRRRTLATELRS
jgi:uncharacterized membrane protein